MICRFGVALTLGACLLSGVAVAQTASRPSTPFVIHSVMVDGAERVAREHQPLLVQPVTSVRSARLEAETPAESAGWFKAKSFPAGTLMFGAYTDDEWSYCAVAESRQTWWSADQFICYVDEDDDGRFDAAIDSGEPFNGVPLLVFSTGESRPLPAPAPYSRIPLADGPGIEYAVSFDVVRPTGRAMLNDRNVPRAATHIIPSVGFRVEGGRVQPLSGPGSNQRIPLVNGQTATIRVKGAVIEILGVNNDNSVRYRVVEAIPAHVDQIMLQIITTTRWVVY